MRITYVPQRMDVDISYMFDGERITATANGVSDTFDFSHLPDGEAQVELIETTLPENPIRSAKRVDGELYVELPRYVPARPQESGYDTAAEYEAALEAWKRLWTDVEEVV